MSKPSSILIAREIKQKLRCKFSVVFFGTPFICYGFYGREGGLLGSDLPNLRIFYVILHWLSSKLQNLKVEPQIGIFIV